VQDAASHERFLRLAIELAEKRVRTGGGPFGALVVREGRVVGTGFNAVVRLGDPTAHAEMQAIRDACARLGTHRLDGCALYTSCEPCPMCLGAIYWARLGSVYFAGTRTEAAVAGFDDARFHEDMARVPAERAIRLVRMLGEEGQRPFTAWLSKPDRVPY
jgi:guanine deaminase